ncbi:hypothetical protein ONS95_013715 [Cadophora gregata]|uniref:uncharacterized protein n=1 Tax=Cadophora gregata TaxID=51156 RepID=UPI0026DAC9EB|nr:uncharacterized protein ONS95_013715 [Cadophora gregata]KAK0113457.1 hypothetical protein ONS96_014323 [Cadophora gregata f. sp. sojae]KAK0114216.1 hypothetical protein ONS95_013715 [Cadophora gregata]
MGIRSRLRALSSSGRRSPSPHPPSQTPSQPPPPAQTFGPLPANLPEPIILTVSSPLPSITILTQAIDSKPVFQIDESSTRFVTHIPTNQPLGSVIAGADNNLTINHPATSTAITYKDDLRPPPWFQGLYGNAVYWNIPACNEWQATIHCEIVDGIDHPNDEEDLAMAVILDSKLRKGRIEIRKQMTKYEMDFLLLTALAEIEDLKKKMAAIVTQAAAAPGRSGGGKVSAGQYLSVMNNAMHFANQAAHAGGYGGDSGEGYSGDSGGGGGGGGDGGGGGGGGF